jgi:hypothetical protein
MEFVASRFAEFWYGHIQKPAPKGSQSRQAEFGRASISTSIAAHKDRFRRTLGRRKNLSRGKLFI